MENAALIYSYRQWEPGIAHTNMDIPLIPSIASFRAFDTTTPIYVIDSSNCQVEWSDFPKKLDFRVVKQLHAFQHMECLLPDMTIGGTKVFWNLLSKPLDVYELVNTLPHEVFIVVDGDAFFIKNLWPLMDDPAKNFVCGFNTGFYYFHKHKPATAQVFETWGALCALALTHPRIRKKMLVSGWNCIQEEAIYRYMMRCHAARLFLKQIYRYENFEGYLLPKLGLGYDVRMIKVLHFCQIFGRGVRGKAALAIKEIRDVITQVLDKDDLQRIFGDYDPPSYPLELGQEYVDLIKQTIQ